uniref:Ig-like domain-containing protein n=1 Tax=Parastrongyloides trichosuri TaxID=131310 RepID=A0A0N4ZI77_PARTI
MLMFNIKDTRVFVLFCWSLLFFLSFQKSYLKAEDVGGKATVNEGDTSVWRLFKHKVINLFRDQEKYNGMLKVNPCYEFGCLCENSTDTIVCNNSNFDDLMESNFTSFIPQKIFLRQVSIYHFNFTRFIQKFPNIVILDLEHCRIRDFDIGMKQYSLKELYMNHNYLYDFDGVCTISKYFPNLKVLHMNFNHIKAVKDCSSDLIYSNIKNLSLTNNEITDIKGVPLQSLESLDISNNQISSLSKDIFNRNKLKTINISNNPLGKLPEINSLYVNTIEANNLKINDISIKKAPKLERLSLIETDIYFFNLTKQDLRSLKYLNLKNSYWLTTIDGEAPSTLKYLELSHSLVSKFPDTFFDKTKDIKLELKNSTFSCNKCFLTWSRNVVNFNLTDIGCKVVKNDSICDVVIDNSMLPRYKNITIIREKLGLKKEIPCNYAGSDVKRVEWKLYHPETYIGGFDMNNKDNPVTVYKPNHYQILPGGALLLKDIQQDMVERYTCTVFSENKNVSVTMSFRLDFSQWYSTDVFNSVFWGACFCSLMTCLASFAFNITWIILKNVALWWLNRAERLSRVKGMVDAIEKYRQKQVERIHEGYHRNVEAIRENYNAQREQLTMSYANQMKKFSDYRQQRIENIHEHIEGIRDQYNQQIQRIKEFGSKRAEQLCDSYEQQLIRVKTFTLQNRLKLVRQYKVKQKVINKLLERYNDNGEEMNETNKEEEIRRVLNLNELDLETNESLLERSPSYYSLPEFCTNDDISSIRSKSNFTSPNRHVLNNQSSIDQELSDGKTTTKTSIDISPDLPGPSGVAMAPLIGNDRKVKSISTSNVNVKSGIAQSSKGFGDIKEEENKSLLKKKLQQSKNEDKSLSTKEKNKSLDGVKKAIDK